MRMFDIISLFYRKFEKILVGLKIFPERRVMSKGHITLFNLIENSLIGFQGNDARPR